MHEREELMKLKDIYLEKVEQQVKEWKMDLDTLKERADRAETQTRSDHYKQLDNLKAKQLSAEANLEELKEAGEESWEDLKVGYEKLQKDMQESIANAQTSIT